MPEDKNDKPLTEEEITSLSFEEISSRDTFIRLFSENSTVEQTYLKIALKNRAKKLRCSGDINALLKAYEEELKLLELPKQQFNVPLEYDTNGNIKSSPTNFENILRYDKHFYGIRYNLLSNSPEKQEINGKIRQWRDSDDTEMYSYIYRKYKIHNPQMCLNALTNIFTEREYHPVKEVIEGLEWDGKPRIENFLSYALKCDNTPYTKEVSRLIFAGGIHRVYNPGCKFDNVPVLIGTNQGEGKSTVIRWLAMDDKNFTEITTIEGKEGVEGLTGKWICELAELMAVTRSKEVEAVKAFLSRSTDHMRRAFARRTLDYPRQCIFIGTTNKERFLTDKTGNRRFFPVKVHTKKYEVFSREHEIKEYIGQCWAEAKNLYDEGRLPPFPDYSLIKQIEAEQSAALEDDWRVAAISEYLENENVNKVCVRQLWREALGNGDFSNPSRKDSNEICLIMQNLHDWERSKNTIRIAGYGKSLGWIRKGADSADDFGDLEI